MKIGSIGMATGRGLSSHDGQESTQSILELQIAQRTNTR